MDIVVNFRNGEWHIRPEPAEAKIGQSISWIVRAEVSSISRLRWIIYFAHGVPFLRPAFPQAPPFRPSIRLHLRVVTLNSRIGTLMNKDQVLANRIHTLTGTDDIIPDHQAVTDSLVAEVPGEYKYGVKVEDAESGEVIGDDDPTLIVF